MNKAEKTAIDYETYKRKFGTRNKHNDDRYISISEDIYNFLSDEKRFGIAVQNEINLALMEDVFIHISTGMMTNDEKGDLSAWKKVGQMIKKILCEYKEDENDLNERYYQVAASPDEREFFADNPIKIDGKEITLKTISGLYDLSMFYRAMCTDVGEKVRNAIMKEKGNAVKALYDAKQKNGTSSYYKVLNFIIDRWSQRISMYESYSNSLKFVNRSIKNVRR